MKKIFYVIVCAFMVSCSNAPKVKSVEASNEPDTTTTTAFESTTSEPDTTTSDDTALEQKQTVSNTDKSSDWDVALDEYEKYMDDYIRFIKKGKAGDATAMLDAVELMSKAESVSKQLNDAKDELTTKQIKKFAKIQTKMLDAL